MRKWSRHSRRNEPVKVSAAPAVLPQTTCPSNGLFMHPPAPSRSRRNCVVRLRIEDPSHGANQ
jgi:hypothetical protein